ncbi:MAG: hypothetical protein KF712_12895 [Akkermansiaceae bacterium]|nr:hypothetical protein [Akkermansiaceae bacterium]
MKTLPLLFLFLAPPWFAHAQEASQSELPALEVLPQDILSARTVHDGLRDVTLQKLDPAAMEDQRLALPPAALSRSAPPVAETEGGEETPYPRPVHTLVLGAGVYIPDKAHPDQAVTHLQIQNHGRSVSLWVPANFLWLSGHGEIATETARCSLLMMVSESIGGPDGVPSFFSLPPGGFVVAAGEPTAEETAALQVLLDFYHRETPLLRARYEAHLVLAAAAAAERATNPPERKPVVMRYWRADEAAIRAAREGGAR